jgi:hypothetical protein
MIDGYAPSMTRPPSTVTVCPVRNCDASLQKNTSAARDRGPDLGLHLPCSEELIHSS